MAEPIEEEDDPATLDQRINQAAQMIAQSKYLVIFTGAGISTASGIPDFRGPNGVWTRRDKGLPPPRTSKPWEEIEPNAGHLAITELQELGIMKFLISQNVDNLHLKSGIHPDLIAEFHGNSALMRCLECDKQFPKEDLWDEAKWGSGYRTSKPKVGQPVCPDCGGRIISSVVNFQDPIPEKEYSLSVMHSEKADVFLAIGSSLSVTPAAHMPVYAKQNGAKLIIVNKMKTPLDNKSDIRFFESAEKVLPAIVIQVKAINLF
jgi:NAD-dependent SIR2 family protein deacetylase